MKDDADETQLEQPPESGGAPESEQRLFQIWWGSWCWRRGQWMWRPLLRSWIAVVLVVMVMVAAVVVWCRGCCRGRWRWSKWRHPLRLRRSRWVQRRRGPAGLAPECAQQHLNATPWEGSADLPPEAAQQLE